MILPYRYRLLPSERQSRALAWLRDEQRRLYNASLEKRIGCYHKTAKSIDYFDHACSHGRLTIDRDCYASLNILWAGLSAGCLT